MRILMIAPQPFFQPRGTPFSVLGRLHALSQLGHIIDLVTYHLGENVQIPQVTIHRIPNIPFIKNVKVGPSYAKIPMDIVLFWKAVTLLHKGHYDLLHTHEEAGFMGILLRRWFKLPHLYDMHSSLPQQLHNFQFSRSKIFHSIFKSLENTTLKSAAGVITICPELYDYVESLSAVKNHVLIENVVDYASLFSSQDGDANTTLFTEQGWQHRKKILYVGTFEPYQGIDLLVKGAKGVVNSCPQAHFLLVGGKTEQVEFYKKMVTDQKLESHFTFTGSVSPRTAEKFVEFADVLVSPRTSGNNTPLKIYSYLRSGKPIIATRLITHTQVLDDSVCILTDPEPESFARGIIQVLSDAELVQKVTTNAQKLAEEKYSYPIYLKKLRQVIDNINMNMN